jgi:ribokinase
VKAVDTTAAGDVFNGSLAVALAEGRSLISRAFCQRRRGVSVTRQGPRVAPPEVSVAAQPGR